MTGLPPEFADAAFAAPDDDTPRLAAADWLTEHGRPECGEFVRLQCELARPETPRDRAKYLRNRCRLLRKRNNERWLEPLDALGARAQDAVEVTFERGFLDTAIVLGGTNDAGLACLAHAPLLSKLVAREAGSLTPAGLPTLAACRNLGTLRLRLAADAVPFAALEPLAASLPRLAVWDIAGPAGSVVAAHWAAIRDWQRPIVESMPTAELATHQRGRDAALRTLGWAAGSWTAPSPSAELDVAGELARVRRLPGVACVYSLGAPRAADGWDTLTGVTELNCQWWDLAVIPAFPPNLLQLTVGVSAVSGPAGGWPRMPESLERLSVERRAGVDDAGLFRAVDGLPNLRELSVTGTGDPPDPREWLRLPALRPTEESA